MYVVGVALLPLPLPLPSNKAVRHLPRGELLQDLTPSSDSYPALSVKLLGC